MQITVIDVGTPNTHQSNNGLTYKSIEVIYKDQSDQILSKKLVSFANKDVFTKASSWIKGTRVLVKVDETNRFKPWVSTADMALDISDIDNDIPY